VTSRTNPSLAADQEALAEACPACSAQPGALCRRRSDPEVVLPWTHPQRSNPPVVLIDIDGVVADMTPFEEHLLPQDGDAAGARWRRFFAHVREAATIDGGVDLVHALHTAGVRIKYSTTRPAYAITGTVAWLKQHELPVEAIFARGSLRPGKGQRRFPHFDAAHLIKQAHCAEMVDRHGLVAFVDDESDIVDALRTAGYPAIHVNEAAGMTMKQLLRWRVQPTAVLPPQPRAAAVAPAEIPASVGTEI
jgi:hypothetical protein